MTALDLEPGQLSLLAGCPPCQGFSSLRRLNGGKYVRDEQNALMVEFLRFVRVLKPLAIMLENVPRMASYWRLPRFRRTLSDLGYKWTAKVLDAACYGVPQRRKRFILLASKCGTPWLAPEARSQVTVRDAIGPLGRPGS